MSIIVRLSEIPSEGRTYALDQTTGELNHVLEDLIGSRPYRIDLHIRPIGNVYEVVGQVKCQVQEICNRCGWEIEVPIARTLQDILMPEDDIDRKTKFSHQHHSEEERTVTFFSKDRIDLGEFVHEAIALAMPFYPECGDQNCVHLKEVIAQRNRMAREFETSVAQQKGHPGFEVLKNLKLENQEEPEKLETGKIERQQKTEKLVPKTSTSKKASSLKSKTTNQTTRSKAKGEKAAKPTISRTANKSTKGSKQIKGKK